MQPKLESSLLNKKEVSLLCFIKKDKSRHFLKNLPYISLLNTDYKIIAKLIAKRLKNVLPLLINNDQTDYLKNRYISENIR